MRFCLWIQIAAYLSSAGILCAQVNEITSPAALQPTDSLDWAAVGPNGSLPSLPFVVNTPGGLGVTINDSSGVEIFTGPQGSHWIFPPLDQFVTDTDGIISDISPIILAFSKPVTSGGCYIQVDHTQVPGPFSATVQAYNGTTLIGTFTETGNSTNPAIFLGVRSTAADITSLRFVATGNPTYQLGELLFAIRPGTVIVPAISQSPVAATSVPGGTTVSITAADIVSIANNDVYATDPNGTITQPPSLNTGAYNYFFNQAPVGPPVVGAKKFQNTTPFGSVVLPSAPYGSLLGGFSTSGPPATWFLVGSSATLTAPLGGSQTLSLVVNDCSECYGDNSGAFTATVEIQNACSYTVAPPSFSFGANGGTGDIVVTTSPAFGCGWKPSIDVSWITPVPVAIPQVCTQQGCAGPPFFQFSVAANPSPTTRMGTITIAGVVATVTQAGEGACSYTINPNSQIFNANGGSGHVSVAAPGGCPWSAISNASWITVESPASGSGHGSAGFTVAPNPGGPRSGSLTIAGTNFTVTEEASACGATDVSDKIAVLATAFQGVPPLFNFDSSRIILHNTSGQLIPGPIYLVMDGLPRFNNQFCPFGCGLSPAQPLTFCQSPAGSYLVLFSPGALGSGQSVAATLLFVPGSGAGGSNQKFSYKSRVFSGTPNQ